MFVDRRRKKIYNINPKVLDEWNIYVYKHVFLTLIRPLILDIITQSIIIEVGVYTLKLDIRVFLLFLAPSV